MLGYILFIIWFFGWGILFGSGLGDIIRDSLDDFGINKDSLLSLIVMMLIWFFGNLIGYYLLYLLGLVDPNNP